MEVTVTCLISSFCESVRAREKVTHAVIHANWNAHQHVSNMHTNHTEVIHRHRLTRLPLPGNETWHQNSFGDKLYFQMRFIFKWDCEYQGSRSTTHSVDPLSSSSHYLLIHRNRRCWNSSWRPPLVSNLEHILLRSNKDILKKMLISCTYWVATRMMWSVFACLLRPPSAHKHKTH